jgi:hypothetical protein
MMEALRKLWRRWFPTQEEKRRRWLMKPLSEAALDGMAELRFFGFLSNSEYQRYVQHANECAAKGIPRRCINEWLAYDRVKPEGVPPETERNFDSVYDATWFYQQRAEEARIA